jgi:hypothetical protein
VRSAGAYSLILNGGSTKNRRHDAGADGGSLRRPSGMDSQNYLVGFDNVPSMMKRASEK